jgi:hypothetical protein
MIRTRRPCYSEALGFKISYPDKDSISNIPSSLVDVVEVISDGEFELLFPLNHKRPFQRTALGIGETRMLLVRLVIRNGTEAPKFCIHLHPDGNDNPGSGASSDRHTYCQVHQWSSIPDTSFCHGRVSRVIYQLNRALWRHLKPGFVSLDATYKLLAAAIEKPCKLLHRLRELPRGPHVALHDMPKRMQPRATEIRSRSPFG